MKNRPKALRQESWDLSPGLSGLKTHDRGHITGELLSSLPFT